MSTEIQSEPMLLRQDSGGVATLTLNRPGQFNALSQASLRDLQGALNAIAAEARFAVSGINVGLFCSTPAVALSRNMGRKQAMEMLLTGDFGDAFMARRAPQWRGC